MGEAMVVVVVVALVVVVLTAYLSLLESSVLSVDELRLVTLLQKKPPTKKYIKRVFQKKREHLSALVLLTSLVSIAGSSLIGGIAAKVFNNIGLAIFTAMLTYFMLVFAKMLPKAMAAQTADQVISEQAKLICAIHTVVKPFLGMTCFWLKIIPAKPGHTVTCDDLKGIIRHYNKRGVIGGDQRRLAETALKLKPATLEDLISSSGKTTCFEADDTIAAIADTLRESPYKRYVVTREGEPVGVVLYRHLAHCMMENKTDITVGKLMRETIYLPPDTTLVEAVFEFQDTNTSVALLPGKTPETVRFITIKQVYHALLQGARPATIKT